MFLTKESLRSSLRSTGYLELEVSVGFPVDSRKGFVCFKVGEAAGFPLTVVGFVAGCLDDGCHLVRTR